LWSWDPWQFPSSDFVHFSQSMQNLPPRGFPFPKGHGYGPPTRSLLVFLFPAYNPQGTAFPFFKRAFHHAAAPLFFRFILTGGCVIPVPSHHPSTGHGRCVNIVPQPRSASPPLLFFFFGPRAPPPSPPQDFCQGSEALPEESLLPNP